MTANPDSALRQALDPSEPAGVGTAEMDRATLADNISAFIAAIAEGITNGEATRAIMVNVDEYVTASRRQAKEEDAKIAELRITGDPQCEQAVRVAATGIASAIRETIDA